MTAIPMQYSSDTKAKPNKTAAGVMLLVTPVLLIALSGCFLIGVMMISNPFQNLGMMPAAPAAPTMGNMILVAVLYAFSIITFLCALWVLSIGVRWLKKVVLE